MVRPPLTLPARPQGYTGYGATQHTVTGLCGWPTPGLPADLSLIRQPQDELERVRVSCAIIFFASIFQFAIWTAALLHQAETLQPAVRFGGREHAFMFAKLALYPCASLLAFTATCLLSRFSTAIFHLMQISVPSPSCCCVCSCALPWWPCRAYSPCGKHISHQARPVRWTLTPSPSCLPPASTTEAIPTTCPSHQCCRYSVHCETLSIQRMYASLSASPHPDTARKILVSPLTSNKLPWVCI